MDGLFTLLFPILFSLVWAVLFFFIRKEEKKNTYDAVFRVQAARTVRLFFIIFSVLIAAGMVAIAILAFFSPNLTGFLIGEGVLAFFGALTVFGYVYARFTYCVVAEDHLLLVKLIGKNRVIPFEKIAYVSAYDTGFGNLSGYDENGIPLFGFDHTDIGVSELEKRLRECGIPPAPKPFPTETMKNTEAYKTYRKRSNRLAFGVVGGLWGAIILTFLIIWLATH
ncbi:MAG: hypothetical protein IJX72_04915 [Clostridia bacterium]|nr:hypothetical protein [Clostridia bacterium]